MLRLHCLIELFLLIFFLNRLSGASLIARGGGIIIRMTALYLLTHPNRRAHLLLLPISGWCWSLHIEPAVRTLEILLLVYWHHFDRLLLVREPLLVTILRRRFKKVTAYVLIYVVLYSFCLAAALPNDATSRFWIAWCFEFVLALGVICLMVELHFLLIKPLLLANIIWNCRLVNGLEVREVLMVHRVWRKVCLSTLSFLHIFGLNALTDHLVIDLWLDYLDRVTWLCV